MCSTSSIDLLISEQRYSKYAVAMKENMERRFISSAAHDQGCVMRVSVTDTTRIAPALLGLRLALKISIYDYLSKFNQINAELFLNCYDAVIFIAVSQ